MRHTRKSGALGLWMNGQPVGSWVVTAQGEEHQLHYGETWLASPLGRPISLSMSLRPAGAPYKGERVRNYFENLLPDNDNIRQRLARRFSTGTEAFRLLAEIGRDCVGALQLLPAGESPPATESIQFKPLSDEQVAEHLAGTLTAPPFPRPTTASGSPLPVRRKRQPFFGTRAVGVARSVPRRRPIFSNCRWGKCQVALTYRLPSKTSGFATAYCRLLISPSPTLRFCSLGQ